MIKIPVEIGDIILTGKFKNKVTVIKNIGTDDHGMPTINGKKVVTFRIKKVEKNESTNGESKMATKKQKLNEEKFDGKLISLYLHGMINVAYKGNVKDARDYLEYMLKIDKEGKDFWNAVYSLLKKLYKKDLGESKMSEKKQKLDEGLVMISSLLPVGPKLKLSMRGDKPDNFVFKGLPGQFNEQGEKVFDEFGDPIKEDKPIVKEAELDNKYYRDLLGTVEEGLNELVNIGEDGEVFRSPKSAHKMLNQAYKLVNKVQ